MKQTFVALIKRGSAEVSKPKKLPAKLKAVLEKGAKMAPEKFARALEPWLTANFVAENVRGVKKLFNFEGDGDVWAVRVRLWGAAPEGKGALPVITAEAYFELDSKKKLTDAKLEPYDLTDAVNFFWKLDDETQIVVSEHEGAGFGLALTE